MEEADAHEMRKFRGFLTKNAEDLSRKFEENSWNFSAAHCFSPLEFSSGKSLLPIIWPEFSSEMRSSQIFLQTFQRKFTLFVTFPVDS